MLTDHGRRRHKTNAHDAVPSRTRQRRDALGILKLAGQLLDVPSARLATLNLPDDVLREIEHAHRVRSKIAHKRQIAFLAKVLRRHDETVFSKLRNELYQPSTRKHEETATQQRLQKLCQELLGENADNTLSVLCQQHPNLDRQQLRTLIRRSHTEQEAEHKPRKAYLAILNILKTLDNNSSHS